MLSNVADYILTASLSGNSVLHVTGKTKENLGITGEFQMQLCFDCCLGCIPVLDLPLLASADLSHWTPPPQRSGLTEL